MGKEEQISLDRIGEIVAESGYEIIAQDAASLRARELQSGVVITAVLEEDVLFNTVSCKTVPADTVNQDTMFKMLDAHNGISTSSFQLYKQGNDKFTITLNNFCKLMDLGAEDRDDILSCFNFLVVDTFAARDLLGE